MLDEAGITTPDSAEAADIAARIRRGDAAAEAEFVQRYGRGLLIQLRRLTGDPDLAQDLRQDVLQLALERLRTRGIDQPERLAGWLAGAARRLALGEARKQARRQTYTGLLDESEHMAMEQDDQLDVLEREEQVALVRRLIRELPTARDRELLYRYYVGGEEKAALCDRFQLTPEHFHRVLFRARQRFRALHEAQLGERRRLGEVAS